MGLSGPTGGQRKQVLKMIWGAMLGAVLTYGVVCLVIVGAGDAGRLEENNALRYALSAAAILVGAVSVWWRRRFLPGETAAGAPVKLAFAQVQSHSVIVWALSEAVALFGLVMGVLTHSFAEFLPFALAAAALLLLHRPSNLPLDQIQSADR